ncbi:type I restriction endonuclease subunit R [Pseudoalteromonas sp. SG45-5]|uniref:type I restriction endonuclease subunit R n=1 Tax=unclassified Pseudoalteromonas TaxID=194690 RepID=UPI0015FD6520|nr:MULTISPECIES: type I restriction endonuclease subunit R [unclassified Pseudoalteromonas]MBB1386454.1 type I restriction endonuclease subunit R [Pseudoalteromonas sp. SG45-5]MBB1394494.1 type I restriction endonuclease subunit R [Pseudoalteromonas sp. SG44-4]MBB1446906.1 type I restriction endonuclease subunit R [Pseudoalteromonas sp. SG41-6]
MAYQSEQQLEDKLVAQLAKKVAGKQQFEKVNITDVESLRANLKKQLSKLNGFEISDNELKQIRNALGKGNVFDKAKILRDRLQINKDDGTAGYIRFIDDDVNQNHFQVTQQVTVEGRYKNRYDVTILVNGLPLVQIELKRRGLELKEAFNQINRYQRHSYWAEDGLFQYVQVFVISNGVNTKYYANNRKQSFKQTFFWAKENNDRYTELGEFAKVFLTPNHLTDMITKYVVLNETDRILMVMRPYQIYATEAIIDGVAEREKLKASNQSIEKQNGYIWHTTGSGKTLTSFKTAQLLTGDSAIHKVVFVVDRKDLDYQTAKEFNSFIKGCVDGTDKTKVLVDQFTGKDVYYLEKDGEQQSSTKAKGGKVNTRRNEKLIVTTIQKLNNAISNKRYSSRMEPVKDKNVIFIFDECHRSQFGDTHKRIRHFFMNHQMFGFTGTPIFAENAVSKFSRKYTTSDLFHKPLHKYTIVDAIKDENVLKFNVEYVGRYKKKDSANEVDIDVEGIDTKELMESEVRLEKITDYIIAQHNRKTHSKAFTGMFCVSSVPALIKYYELFAQKKAEDKHNLKIATIFSYAANEEDPDADGLDEAVLGKEVVLDKVAEPQAQYEGIASHSRDRLEEFIGDYNKMFGSSYTTKDSESYYNYYNDISKKVRERKVDILLVVNMFLTGFDSKTLNTLYVDKNLKYHGLIQAYSRTNRILNEQKSQGNIISFRNLKKRTDDALALFSNKDAKDTVIMPPYEEFIKMFNQALDQMQIIAPDTASVDSLEDENAELEFIKAFRELMRLRNVLSTFADFKFDDVCIQEQEYEDYKSKYLDLYDKVKTNTAPEKESILEEIDFELELLAMDEVNVAYILKLLSKLKQSDSDEEYQQQYKSLMQTIGGDPELRSKQELIDKFIQENLPDVQSAEEVDDAFAAYWEVEKEKATQAMAEEEHLIPENVKELVERMIFSNQEPLREDIVATMEKPPSVLQRKKVIPRLAEKLKGFVNTFYGGM